MMLRSKSSQKSLFRFAIAIPILLVLVMAFRNENSYPTTIENSNQSLMPVDTVPGFEKSDVFKAIQKDYVTLKNSKNEAEAQKVFSKLFMMKESYLESYPQFKDQIAGLYSDIQKTFSDQMEKSIKLPIMGENGIYKRVEEMPTFKGCDPTLSFKEKKRCGDTKMLQFVYEHIKYPEIARKNKIEGTVVIRFVIDAQGQVQNPQIVRDIGATCGDSALAVVNKMVDKWLPGKQDGKAVPVQFNLPIKFKLTPGKSSPLYVVDDQVVTADKVNTATGNYQNIKSIDYLNAKRAVPLYGEAAKAGAVVITTLPNSNRKKSGPSLDVENFKVYPVPNAGQFQVEFTAKAMPLEFSILDIKGVSIFQKSYKDFNGHFSENIELQKVASGVVMIHIQQDQKTFTYPVIIK